MLTSDASSSTTAVCLTDKDNSRVRDAYARGSHTFLQLGLGMQPRHITSNGHIVSSHQFMEPSINMTTAQRLQQQRRRRQQQQQQQQQQQADAAAASQQRVRLAVVIPWVVEAMPAATCKALQTRPEMKAGARCEAFFTLPISWAYWLASAATNAAMADFLIFCEPGLPAGFFRGPGSTRPLPSNVRVVEVANLTELYRARMGKPRLELNPDKIKDFKPAVGHVFEHFLRPYSHWAFGDVDVVYGDLSRFLTPQLLAHDIITFRTDDLCASMTKTLFAGQLTVFANNPWCRTLYREAPMWEKVAATGARYMFFDERSMPVHALRQGAGRIAMVINQLSDRLFTRLLDGPARSMWARTGLRGGARRHLLWHGVEGRLLLVERRGETDAAAAEAGGNSLASQQGVAAAAGTRKAEWCVVSEAALVHLQQHKFKHFGALPAFDAAGFVFERERGIRPARTLLNASSAREAGGGHDPAVATLLTAPLTEAAIAGDCMPRTVQTIMERSMF